MKFFHIDDRDVADPKYYTSYVYNLITLHNFVLNLYNDTFFEEDWWDVNNTLQVQINPTIQIPSTKVDIFGYFVHIYGLSMQMEKQTRQYFKWEDENKGKRFQKKLKEMYEPDCVIWKYSMARWRAYKIYRQNRINIVTRIALKGRYITPAEELMFVELSDRLNAVPLRSSAENGYSSGDDNIGKYFNDHDDEMLAELRSKFNMKKFGMDKLRLFVNRYIECRFIAYSIFNKLTEVCSPHVEMLMPYCSNGISDADLKKLIELTRVIQFDDRELQSEDPNSILDNYWQHLEQRSWYARNLGESAFYGLFPGQEPKDKSVIRNIRPMSPNTRQCDVLFDGVSVTARRAFHPGDVIEVCPTKPISKSSLYSKDMRDIAFEVVRNETFVIPFGYCQYYDVPVDGSPTNCFFEWDESNRSIRIIASRKIVKGEVLVLDVEDGPGR